MPQNPFPISGFAPNNGANVAITQKNLTTGEEETVYTESDGSFLCDPANLSSGYDAELGDIIRITAPELGLYAEVVCNTELYPDGIEISLTRPVGMVTIIPGGVMGKFAHMDDRVMAFPGGVSAGKSGLS